jgi:Ca2+-binding EF-hand superfamily protein
VGWRQLTRSPPSAPLVLQPELSEALLDEILGAADTDGDGNINLQEFRAAVMSR